jgi:hypothetical protein
LFIFIFLFFKYVAKLYIFQRTSTRFLTLFSKTKEHKQEKEAFREIRHLPKIQQKEMIDLLIIA